MTNEPEKTRGQAVKKINQNPPRVALEWKADDTLDIQPSGTWDRILKASGNQSVAAGLIWQSSLLGSKEKQVDSDATDFALGFVDAMQPRDAAETLLLSQMAATHMAAMMLARQLNHVSTIQQKDCAERALNKTARTFAAQMDTLKRYRSKGQQTVRVERVTVNEGGQAIVGDVRHGGRGHEEK